MQILKISVIPLIIFTQTAFPLHVYIIVYDSQIMINSDSDHYHVSVVI